MEARLLRVHQAESLKAVVLITIALLVCLICCRWSQDAEIIAKKLGQVSGMQIFTHQVTPSQFEISPQAEFRAAFKVKEEEGRKTLECMDGLEM